MAIGAAVSVRRASIEDACAIARVHVDTWRAAYAGIVADSTLSALTYAASTQRQLGILGDNGRLVFVAVDAGIGVVGFAMGGPARGAVADCDGELYGLYVHPTHQGRGIGRRLVATMAKALADGGFSRVLVWALSENPARAFYEKLGGAVLEQKDIDIKGQTLRHISYGWDVSSLVKAAGGACAVGWVWPGR